MNKQLKLFAPPDKQHELGARMISDYFTMNGFKSTFVGSNTLLSHSLKPLELMNLII
jgi:methanogenic corrinoid protein MtbC1